MKYIVFDLYSCQPIGKIKFHGGGEYIKTVFKAFSNNHHSDITVVACFEKSNFIDDWILNIIEDKNYNVEYVKSLNDIINYVRSIAADNEVRFFAGLPYLYNDFSLPPNVISIATCHGLRAIEKQSDEYLLHYYSGIKWCKEIAKHFLRKRLKKKYMSQYKRTISNFDEIITDSNHSCYALKYYFADEIKNKKLHTFYPLTQEINRGALKFDPEVYTSEKYIMILSADRWIKNSYRAVQAIDSLYDKGQISDYRVKIYGNAPQSIRNMVRNKDKFIFYDYVDRSELEEGYKNCEILLYPTLNEGFGNVPMEAMKYGKTCVVAAVCSLPEVYGQAVYWCNPYDIPEMANRVLQAIDKKISKEVIVKRLEYLYKRQIVDMKKTIDLIVGINEE